MAQCPACHTSLRQGARFCGQCGQAVASRASADRPGEADRAETCTDCGQPLPAAAGFCGRCGTPRPGRGATRAPERLASAMPGPALPVLPGRPVLYVLAESSRRALQRAIAPVMPRSSRILWTATESALERVQATLREHRDIAAVCLIGDDDTLPFTRLADPCAYDDAVLTDSLYGMRHTPTADERMAGDVVPDVPVSRIPSGDPELVARALGDNGPLAADWRGGVIVSAAVWREATSAVARALGVDVDVDVDADTDAGADTGVSVSCSPPHERSEVEDLLSARSPGRLLFNVHGTDQDAVWLGEGDGRYPEILRPPGVRVARSAIAVSEACYGATLIDGAGSMAPAFLAAGAGVFLGSTIIAWGSARGGPPMLADELARHFYAAMDRGLPAAHALQHARVTLVEHALDHRGLDPGQGAGQGTGQAAGHTRSQGAGLSAPMHNTLLSFVLYGRPDRVAPARPRAVARAVASAGSDNNANARASAASSASATQHARDALDDVRERLRRRLQPDTWRVVSSGRITLAELRAQLGLGEGLSQRLESLLGAPPKDAHVLRYQRGARATVLASARVGSRTRYAGVDIDAHGNLLGSYVSR